MTIMQKNLGSSDSQFMAGFFLYAANYSDLFSLRLLQLKQFVN